MMCVFSLFYSDKALQSIANSGWILEKIPFKRSTRSKWRFGSFLCSKICAIAWSARILALKSYSGRFIRLVLSAAFVLAIGLMKKNSLHNCKRYCYVSFLPIQTVIRQEIKFKRANSKNMPKPIICLQDSEYAKFQFSSSRNIAKKRLLKRNTVAGQYKWAIAKSP